MDIALEREYAIDNMGETFKDRMQDLLDQDRNDDAIAVMEEWVVYGQPDPQDEDYRFMFLKNFTLDEDN